MLFLVWQDHEEGTYWCFMYACDSTGLRPGLPAHGPPSAVSTMGDGRAASQDPRLIALALTVPAQGSQLSSWALGLGI